MLVQKSDNEFEKKLNIKTEEIRIIKVPLNKLINEIKKENGKIIVSGGDEIINRKVVENKKVDVLLNSERNPKKDSFHYRRSGLNQVLCKLAKENGVAIGFNFSSLLNSNKFERSKILGRMMFNYKLCKKYKVKMVFSTFAKNKFELRSNDSMRVFE